MDKFTVIPGETVADLLEGQEHQIVDLVRTTYLAHAAGKSVNPDSYFLRFPGKLDSRIIALPAYLGAEVSTAGIKWIASFPQNTATGRPRASAVLILNDYETGFPYALLEAAEISAVRTAASAALAAHILGSQQPARIGIVGAGVIARTICRYLHRSEIRLERAACHDLDSPSALALVKYLQSSIGAEAEVTELHEALQCDLVVLATTALTPHITANHEFRPHQLVLNISLRDLAPEILLRTNNVLDDVEHCLKANTSPHLAEQLTGNRDFITGTLAEVIMGSARLDPAKPTVFSPFGLGVLDLAVGHRVHAEAVELGRGVEIPGFFAQGQRW